MEIVSAAKFNKAEKVIFQKFIRSTITFAG